MVVGAATDDRTLGAATDDRTLGAAAAAAAAAAGAATGERILGASTDVEPLRRLPTQRRAHDRVERILDAADRVLARDEPLGTRAVADAAGVSIGSVYHWFPDKESIALSLALRHWDALSQVVATVASRTRSGEVADPVGETLDALTAGFRARPGFLALWFGELRTEQLRKATRPSRDRVATSVMEILAVSHPRADPEARRVVAGVLTLLGDGVIREAFRLDRDGDEVLLAEGACALRAYVAARLGARAVTESLGPGTPTVTESLRLRDVGCD